MRHHLCRQEVALADTRQLHSQGPMSVHAHRIKGVSGFKGREGANGVGGGIRVGGRGEAKNNNKPHKSCRRDQVLSFRTCHHLCTKRVALAGTRELRSQGPVSVHAHRTEGMGGPKGREGANGVGGGIIVGGWNGDVNVYGDGDGPGRRTEV